MLTDNLSYICPQNELFYTLKFSKVVSFWELSPQTPSLRRLGTSSPAAGGSVPDFLAKISRSAPVRVLIKLFFQNLSLKNRETTLRI